jgi:hypothetical protein
VRGRRAASDGRGYTVSVRSRSRPGDDKDNERSEGWEERKLDRSKKSKVHATTAHKQKRDEPRVQLPCIDHFFLLSSLHYVSSTHDRSIVTLVAAALIVPIAFARVIHTSCRPRCAILHPSNVGSNASEAAKRNSVSITHNF